MIDWRAINIETDKLEMAGYCLDQKRAIINKLRRRTLLNLISALIC